MDESTESTPSLKDFSKDTSRNHTLTTYKRRWWIIGIFFLSSFTQGTIYNTWGPITFSVQIVYGWTDTFTALVPGMADLGFLIAAIPIMYMAQTKGLRYVMVVSVCLLAACSSLWIFGAYFSFDWLVYIGGFFMGMTTGIFTAAAPLLSITWFPCHERTTATALGSLSGYLGEGVSYVTGPVIGRSLQITESDVMGAANVTADYRQNLSDGVMNTLYYNSALAFLSLLCVIVYFPSKPPSPPSHSAKVERLDFKEGFKLLIRDKQFWLITFSYNLPNGVFNSWNTLISVSFASLGITQELGGWLGFASLLGGAFSAILISAIIDKVKRKMKVALCFMVIGQILSFLSMVCIQQGYFHITSQTTITVILYIACILAGALINGAEPLYYELACEQAFPVQEGVAGILMCIVNNVIGILFFFVFLIPAAANDTRWMTWLCLVVTSLSLPCLIFIREKFDRLELETEGERSGLCDINA